MKKIFCVLGLAGLVLCLMMFVDTDSRTRTLLLTTLKLSSYVVLLSIPIGLILAWLISRTDVFGRRAAIAVLTTMLFIPLYLQAAGWDAAFGRQGWLSLSSEISQPWLSGMRAAIWIHALAAIPWVTMILSVALRHCDPELEEAAWLDYSAPLVACKVILPFIMPGIAVAAVWVCILTTSEMTVTDLYQVRTFAEEVYTVTQLMDESSASESKEIDFAEQGTDESSASESSNVTLPRGTGTLLALLLAGLFVAGILVRQTFAIPVRSAIRYRLGIWRGPGAILLGLLVLLIAGAPFGNFCYNAGLRVEPIAGAIVREWSPSKAALMVLQAPGRFSGEFIWSFIIGVVTATGCLIIGAPLAWIARRRDFRAWPALIVFAVGTAIPGPVLGLWIIRLFSQPGLDWLSWLYDHSILAPVLATGMRALPASVVVCWYGFQTLPRGLLEAASVDGLGPVGQFLRVVTPARWPVMAAAWLLALIVSTGDLAASVLVTPPGLFTVPARVFGLLHAGVDDQVAGLCLAILSGLIALQICVAKLFQIGSD